MDTGDLIMSLVTLALILLFMFNPLFRRLLKALQGEEDGTERGEDRMYESTDARRVLKNLTETSEAREAKKFVFDDGKGPETSAFGKRAASGYGSSLPSPPPGKSELKRAFLWKEILGPPRALKPFGEDDFF